MSSTLPIYIDPQALLSTSQVYVPAPVPPAIPDHSPAILEAISDNTITGSSEEADDDRAYVIEFVTLLSRFIRRSLKSTSISSFSSNNHSQKRYY